MICATEVILYNVCDYMFLGIYVLLLVVDTPQCMEDGRSSGSYEDGRRAMPSG